MKSIKILVSIIPVIILTACNNGGSTQSSATPPAGTISYALGDSGQLYLNNGTGKWSQVQSASLPAGTTYKITCTATTCVSASDSGLNISNNLTQWSPVSQSNNKSALQMTKALYDVVATNFSDGNDLVVGVGQGGSIVTTSTTIAVNSTNTSQPHPSLTATVVNSGTTNDLFQATYDYATGYHHVIGANGTLLQSNDTVTWNPVNLAVKNHFFAEHCIPLREGVSRCTIVGQGGIMFQSIDGGATWHQISLPTTNDLFAIGASAGPESGATLYVAAGNDVILYSYDETTWFQANIPATIDGQLYALYNVVYNGRFVASVALADGSASSSMLVSTDGINWSIPSDEANTTQSSFASSLISDIGSAIVTADNYIALYNPFSMINSAIHCGDTSCSPATPIANGSVTVSDRIGAVVSSSGGVNNAVEPAITPVVVQHIADSVKSISTW